MRYFFQLLIKIFFRIIAFFVPSKTERHRLRDWGNCMALYLSERFSHQEIKNKELAAPENFKLLLAMMDLSITGSPIAALAAVKAVLKNGGRVMVVACRGGALDSEFKQLGVTVLTSQVYHHYPKAIKEIAKGFDVVLVNTILMSSWIDILTPMDKLMWYIHESLDISLEIERNPNFIKTINRCPHLYVVSDHAASFIKPYKKAEILRLGVEDIRAKMHLSPKQVGGSKLRLATIGSIFKRKGQDLIIDALWLLSEDLKSRIEFILMGSPENCDGHQLLDNLPKDLPITVIKTMSDQSAKWDFFNSVDVFCVPSRDESCSLVLLEACMLGKPSIISDQVGGKYMLVDGESGLIFRSEDAVDLARALAWVLENQNRLEGMGHLARAIYLEKAGLDQFENNFMNILGKFVDIPSRT